MQMRWTAMAPVAGLALAMTFAGAAVRPGSFAASSAGPPQRDERMRVAAQDKEPRKERTRAEKCEALMSCRRRYTRCDNKVYASMQPGPKRDKAHDECVLGYQRCIKANFRSTEMLIIRWLWPGSDCPW